MANTNKKQEIGIYITTSLVVGTMIGSGIFLLPASLASLGGISVLGWLISGAGGLLIALLYGRLSKLVKQSGGPYIYPKEGFGEFVGFLSGWGYWVSIVTSVAAVGTVVPGYLFVFIPSLESVSGINIIIPLFIIWILTWVNSRGIRSGGIVQLVTTIFKVVPLLALGFIGIFYIKLENFMPLNNTGESDLFAIGAAVSLTLFAFLGVEFATIPAENIKNPEKNIARATIGGTLLTLVIYILVSTVALGVVGASELATSDAPMADAAFILWGKWGRYFISLGALISVIGAMNGLILVQAQLPMVMARDHLFPPIFKELSNREVPLKGLIVSSVLITIILFGNQSASLANLFKLLILLSTFLNLITYTFSSMSEVMILLKLKRGEWKKRIIPAFLISIPTFLFTIWAYLGSGTDTVFYGFICLMLGIPFYVWSKIKFNQKE